MFATAQDLAPDLSAKPHSPPASRVSTHYSYSVQAVVSSVVAKGVNVSQGWTLATVACCEASCVRMAHIRQHGLQVISGWPTEHRKSTAHTQVWRHHMRRTTRQESVKEATEPVGRTPPPCSPRAVELTDGRHQGCCPAWHACHSMACLPISRIQSWSLASLARRRQRKLRTWRRLRGIGQFGGCVHMEWYSSGFAGVQLANWARDHLGVRVRVWARARVLLRTSCAPSF